MAVQNTKWLSLSLLLLTLVEIAVYVYVTRPARPRSHTYIDDDHPIALDVPPMPHVATFMQNTVHYQLSTPEAKAEWDLLAPREGVVHLGPHRRPFMISVFHQLRCLDVIRDAIVRADNGTAWNWRTRHCMNYVRQTIMCRANTRLEPATGLYEAHNVVSEQEYVCRDWRVVYDAVKQNHREYDEWAAGSGAR